MIDFFVFNNRVIKPVKIPEGYSSKEMLGWTVCFPSDDCTVLNYEDGSTQIIIGDLINVKDLPAKLKKSDIINLLGHYYLISISTSSIKIFTGFLNILPIYFDAAKTIFSSGVTLINTVKAKKGEIDRAFILENVLFNYGFSNRTLYQDISLVPTNHFVEICGTAVSIDSHFNTLQLFSKQPNSYSLDAVANLFIDRAGLYFPEVKHAITFTGGFDGRTLTAVAQFLNVPFITTSFGAPGNDDLELPEIQSRQIGIDYIGYNLYDPGYLHCGFSKHAAHIINKSPGCNGYLYPHFSYHAEKISQLGIKYLLAGYFGSELFRALHIGGALTSEVLYQYFMLDKDSFREYVKNSGRLQFLGFNFEAELNELLNEMDTCFSGLPLDLTVNQKFYYFIFNEVFRKSFGTWITAQMQFVKVRTPFLDVQFITELLKSKYAGPNNDFATKNPFKRLKGQRLYAKVLQKTHSKLYNLKTGKGYCPKALLELPYRYQLLIPYLRKMLIRNKIPANIDNLGIISSIIFSFGNLESTAVGELFDNAHFKLKINGFSKKMKECDRDMILYILSNLSSSLP